MKTPTACFAALLICLQAEAQTHSTSLDEQINVFLASDKMTDSLADSGSLPAHDFRKISLDTRPPNPPATLAMLFFQDTFSLLFLQNGPNWQLVDTITPQYWVWGFGWGTHWTDDCNGDSLVDLIIPIAANVHGLLWCKLYLNAGDGTFRLANPDFPLASLSYNAGTGLLECETPGGVFDISSEEIFRFDGLKLIPLKKLERDTSSLDMFGNGLYIRLYDWVDGNWKLVKEKRFRAGREERFYNRHRLIGH